MRTWIPRAAWIFWGFWVGLERIPSLDTPRKGEKGPPNQGYFSEKG